MESESSRTDIRTEQFLSPSLTSQEINKGLSVIQIPTVAQGRLVIVALIKGEKDKYSGSVPLSSRGTKIYRDSSGTSGKPLSSDDITCWLDDKELTIVRDWADFKKKEYLDILSGFGADTIWCDTMVTEGPHLIFFSLAQTPTKNRFKTFSKSFSIKGGTSNYLFFSFHSDPVGEPDVRVQHILDINNRSLPF